MNDKYEKFDDRNENPDCNHTKHNESCTCSCMQEMYANYSQKNNDEVAYSLTKESIQQRVDYENKKCGKYYDRSLNPFNAWRLPIESTRRQMISSNPATALDLFPAQTGQRLNSLTLPECRHINFNWQLLHIQRNDNNDNQYFILYQTDSGGFVIAG
ncbi:hypothetical protein, partial [Bacillus cereus]|uniref:hypothetical protein n=1 Tax=Bacillus cereus TaxID=1396 RepID=UPI003D1675FF